MPQRGVLAVARVCWNGIQHVIVVVGGIDPVALMVTGVALGIVGPQAVVGWIDHLIEVSLGLLRGVIGHLDGIDRDRLSVVIRLFVAGRRGKRLSGGRS